MILQLTRDKDGYPTLWQPDAKIGKTKHGMWCLADIDYTVDEEVAEGHENVKTIIGSFHGCRKGKKILLQVKVERWGYHK